MRKWRVALRSAAAKTISQRSRTAVALSRAVAPAASSLAESTALDVMQFLRVRHARRCEISGCLLGLDLDCRIERYESIRDRDLLDDLDTLALECRPLYVRHRHPAVYTADAEPVDRVRHQFLKTQILHPGDALSAVEIGIGAISARLSLARVVDEKFGDFTERTALLAVVDNDPDPTLLRGRDADFDTMNQIGPTGADVGAEHIGAVAFVMDTTGYDSVRRSDPSDLAEQIDRRAADRRQHDLEIGPGDEFGEHAAGFLEQAAP